MPNETIKEKCRACGKEFTPFPVIDERGRRYISTVCEECTKKYAK